MQNDDRPHRMAEAFHFLNEHFDDRVISHNYCKRTGSGLNWPSYFPCLTPCDFFLWEGVPERQSIRQNAQMSTEPKEYISAASETIPSITLRNLFLKLHHTAAANNGYIENIIIWCFQTFLQHNHKVFVFNLGASICWRTS